MSPDNGSDNAKVRENLDYAIELWPTGNVQGGFYFYNLWDIISRRIWTPPPMPKDVC